MPGLGLSSSIEHLPYRPEVQGSIKNEQKKPIFTKYCLLPSGLICPLISFFSFMTQVYDTESQFSWLSHT